MRPDVPAADAFHIDPYLDYQRWLTPEGGVAVTYKDIDDRFRHTLRRLVLFGAAIGFAAWYLAHHSPVASTLVNMLCMFAYSVVAWLIVGKPVEVYRKVEIRPDCMILDGRSLFWLRYMENGWPAFRPANDGTVLLSGIYGTRQIDYLTVRRFDEFDRQQEVLASHLQQAMQQLWRRPQ